MPALNIPGFHYDETKKKYFKILPNHVAPEGSKYSIASLQKEAEEGAARKRVKTYEEKTIKQRFQRSRVLTHSLIGEVGLCREGGVANDGEKAAFAAWAQGLRKSKVHMTTDINALFEYDDATGSYVVGSEIGQPPLGAIW